MVASLVQWLWDEGKSRVWSKEQNRCRLIIYPPLLWAALRWGAQHTDLLTPTPGWRGFNAIKQVCRRQTGTSNRVICELHNSTVGKGTQKARVLQPAWDVVGARGWVQLGTWHSKLQRLRAQLIPIICFFLSLLGQEKADRQAALFSGKSQNTSGDIVSPTRLQSTVQLLTPLQAGKNIYLDVQTGLDSSLTSLSAIRALTGK